MFTLDQVVPWGRSFDEYRRMFALTDADLNLTILGCGDGPASFNAEATRRGAHVVSCDPLYGFTASEIRVRIAVSFEQVMDEMRLNADHFVWTAEMRTVEQLGQIRMAAMEAFLDDYDAGRAAGRYVQAELPSLGLASQTFDLALCSHLVFLYSTQLGERFHLEAVAEMCRVAREVRIFPLLALGGQPSPFVEVCARALRETGHDVSIEAVPYEFQRGGNEMMRVRRPAADPGMHGADP